MSTGSSTTCSQVRERSDAATTSIVAGVPSMPIFTTEGSCVTVAASNWSAMTCGSTGTNRWPQSFLGSNETMHVNVPTP